MLLMHKDANQIYNPQLALDYQYNAILHSYHFLKVSLV